MDNNENIPIASETKTIENLSDKIRMARVEANSEATIVNAFSFWGMQPMRYAIEPKK